MDRNLFDIPHHANLFALIYKAAQDMYGEKGAKAAVELKRGVAITNFGQVKRNKDGTPKRLTKAQRSYRSGYLDARNDNAKAYKYNKKKRATRKQ